MSELSPTMEHLKDPYVLQLIEALSMQQDELEDAEDVLGNLIGALDRCKEEIQNAFMMTYNVRGGVYDGPTYEHELAAARELYDNRERSLHRLGNDPAPQSECAMGERVEKDSEKTEPTSQRGVVGCRPQIRR